MYAAVRVRGQPDMRASIDNTLTNLGLTQKNHCVLLPEEDNYHGMLVKAKDGIAFGHVDTETAVALLEEKGETDHGPLSETVEELGYDSVEELVEALESGDVSLGELKDNGFRNVVRLGPPSKGYNDTKRHYNQGGSLGDRGDDITALLDRMR